MLLKQIIVSMLSIFLITTTGSNNSCDYDLLSTFGDNESNLGSLSAITFIDEEPEEKYLITSFDISQNGLVAICSSMCEPYEKASSIICVYNDKMDFLFGIRYGSNDYTGVIWIDCYPAVYEYRYKVATLFNNKGQIVGQKEGDFSDYINMQKKQLSSSIAYYCSNSKKPVDSFLKGDVKYKYLLKADHSNYEVIYIGHRNINVYYIIVPMFLTLVLAAFVFIMIQKFKKNQGQLKTKDLD